MMRLVSVLLVSISLALVLGGCAGEKENVYPLRWFYVSNGLRSDDDVEIIRGLVERAAASGLNGMYLSSGFDGIDLKEEDYFERLHQVRDICAEHGVEIIPRCMDVGYNGGLLSHDQNLAAGLPVRDQLFVVDDQGRAHLVADPPVSIPNGGFEKTSADGVPGFECPGGMGEVMFVDNDEVHEGTASLRFENFGDKEDDPGRLVTHLDLQPDRLYRVSFWVRTDNLDPSNPFGSGRFRVNVLGDGERPLTYFNPRVQSTNDWKQIQVGFNTRGYTDVELAIGVYGGTQGRFWLDDLRVEEIGLVNILRRPGAPLTVANAETGEVYQEDYDFRFVQDPELDFEFDHDGPPITVMDWEDMPPGTKLRVSYYHGVKVYNGQVTACMSEPKMYEIWRRTVPIIHEHLGNDKFFFSVDEIRAGGTCAACQARGLSAGEILSDCIRKGVDIIREVNPEAEIVIWSDMIDPNHNAGDRRGRGYYYHVDETWEGSWENIPRDLIVACWWHRMRYESLGFFSGLGHRTIGCGYYDTDNLDNDVTWLEALDETPGALGLMYTTWLRKYELMDEFGELVSAPRPVPIKKLDQ